MGHRVRKGIQLGVAGLELGSVLAEGRFGLLTRGDVAEHDQLVVLLGEPGVQMLARVLVEAVEEFFVHSCHPRRRLLQPLAIGVLTHGGQDLTYGVFEVAGHDTFTKVTELDHEHDPVRTPRTLRGGGKFSDDFEFSVETHVCVSYDAVRLADHRRSDERH